MTDITLYFAPDTCARIPMIALEETGHPFRTELIAFMRGDHRSPRYLALNPKGRVPTLVVDGRPLTENVAILIWLAARFSEANLLPDPRDALERARVISDLAFCASGLHPIVTRLRIPQYFCDTADGIPRVFSLAEAAMRPFFALIDQRLRENEWWYGKSWSVLDAYINWVWFRVTGTAFDAEPYPNFVRHDARMRQRSSVQRALLRNSEAAAYLDTLGLAVKFSGEGAVRAPAA
jgi:glutathione S-transferase